jgi:hypothetical protein
MGVKERPTRRSGTKRDVSERYELRGFFIELWLKRQSSLLPRHPFSFCTRRIGTKEDVSERYKLRGNHNINPKSDMGRGNKIVIFYFSVKLPACCCNFSIIL